MGLIFVPYIHETLRKNFQRGSSESTSERRSLVRGGINSNQRRFQSFEELVRMYDNNPDTSDAENMPPDASSSGHHSVESEETQPNSDSNSTSPRTEQVARIPVTTSSSASTTTEHSFFLPLRRPQTATPGSTAVSSSLDRRTMRLLEVLSAYYVRAAYDRVRPNNPIPSPPPPPPPPPLPPPPNAGRRSGVTSSLSSSSTSSPNGLVRRHPNSSTRGETTIVISAPAPAVPERSGHENSTRAFNHDDAAVRTRSSQTQDEGEEEESEEESSSRSAQFILGPDSREESPEELRLENWDNDPDEDRDSNVGRPRIINPYGHGVLRAPDLQQSSPDEELLQFVRRRRIDQSISSSSPSSADIWSSSSSGGGGFVQYNWNTDADDPSDSGENSPQAFLWHNETRTNVTNHGCLRVIMRRHQGWEEQAAQNGFVEYWHYSTIPRREGAGFEVIRDGVARLPWPMLTLAGLQTLRSFAYQINTVQHRDTPLTDYQGNIFDVILLPSTNPPRVDN